jgi:FKBP-type peptidyl-prolyl cis-trans isomerase
VHVIAREDGARHKKMTMIRSAMLLFLLLLAACVLAKSLPNMNELQALKRKEQLEKNILETRAWLEGIENEHRGDPAWRKDAESGLIYRVIRTGSFQGHSPAHDQPCSFKYRARLRDGEQLVNKWSDADVAEFTPSEVLRGMGAALQLMRPGDHWELYLSSHLGFGDHQRRYNGHDVPGGVGMVMELELLKVGKRPDPKDHVDNTETPRRWANGTGDDGRGVIHVNDETMKEFDEDNVHYYAFYYDPDCETCQKMLPTITEFAGLSKGVIDIVAVDCKRNFKTCGLADINKVPTLMIHNNKMDRVDEYKGGITVQKLWEFTVTMYGFRMKDYGMDVNLDKWDKDFDYWDRFAKA